MLFLSVLSTRNLYTNFCLCYTRGKSAIMNSNAGNVREKCDNAIWLVEYYIISYNFPNDLVFFLKIWQGSCKVILTCFWISFCEYLTCYFVLNNVCVVFIRYFVFNNVFWCTYLLFCFEQRFSVVFFVIFYTFLSFISIILF